MTRPTFLALSTYRLLAVVLLLTILAGVTMVVLPYPISIVFGTITIAVVFGFSFSNLRNLHSSQQKTSEELGLLWSHVIRSEQESDNAGRSPSADASVPSRQINEPLVQLSDIIAEIGLLSGIVRELASVVAAQESEISRLKAPTIVPKAGGDESDPLPANRSQISKAPEELSPRPDDKRLVVSERKSSVEPMNLGPDDQSIVSAWEAGGLETWLQPVVSLPQRKVVGYDVMPRLRVGDGFLAADVVAAAAERRSIAVVLDRRMIANMVSIVEHLGQRGSPAWVTFALSRSAMREPGFIQALDKMLETRSPSHGRSVIVMPMASWDTIDATRRALIRRLSEHVDIGLGSMTELPSDIDHLAEHGIREIRLPADMLVGDLADGKKPIAPLENFVAKAARSNIRLVATNVERETDVAELIDVGIPFAQGIVLAAPRAVRDEVLQGGPRHDTPVQAPASEVEPKRSFRDFLRRAG